MDLEWQNRLSQNIHQNKTKRNLIFILSIDNIIFKKIILSILLFFNGDMFLQQEVKIGFRINRFLRAFAH